ncbi:MAG: hypothetical protein FD167_3663 [bacterium]|nr:MAG: hypothetical protein FD167_3663 [bacterium]
MSKQILVMINLRGGADGLNIVVPYREENYYQIRPTISLSAPNNTNGVIDLDGFFGIHPALAPLMPLYKNKQLAFLHAVGWPGESHSHFEAWEEIELGIAGQEKPTTGWLTRYLQLIAPESSPLQTINFSAWPSKLFIGCQGTNQLTQLSDFRLVQSNKYNILASLKSLYGQTSTLGMVGQQTINVLEKVNKILEVNLVGRNYPKTKFGNQLQSVAELIKADIGLRATSLDLNGWDTHIMQGGAKGHMANLLSELANSIATFAEHLQDKWKDVLLVVMTEFGRRAMENASAGTEHGQGGVMFFAGGRVRGGRVYGDWPGLAQDQLADPGDLAITTDFRQALSEFIMPQVGVANITKIFPAYQIRKQLGILAS